MEDPPPPPPPPAEESREEEEAPPEEEGAAAAAPPALLGGCVPRRELGRAVGTEGFGAAGEAAEPRPEAVARASCRAGTFRIDRSPEDAAGVGGQMPCCRGGGGPPPLAEFEELAREEDGKEGHDGREVVVLSRC